MEVENYEDGLHKIVWSMRRLVIATVGLLMLMACGGEDGADRTTPAVAAYTVSGSVSHLDAGNVTISDGSESVTVAQGATTFAFTRPLATGTAYTVTVTAQPAGSNCIVVNGTGRVTNAAIGDVALVCNTAISQPITVGVVP